MSESIENQLKEIQESLATVIAVADQNNNVMDENFQILVDRIHDLDVKVSSLTNSTDKSFTEVKEDLKKIQTLTGYDDVLENLKGLE
jgi:hypothetical protein